MLESTQSSCPGFVVIGKSRTLVWDRDSQVHSKPTPIYDPLSRPRLQGTSGSFLSTSRSGTLFSIPGWVQPRLDENYCHLIYRNLRQYDHIYLVGAGVGRWSGINNFMSWAEQEHPVFSVRITTRRYFRLTDFPDEKLRKIFGEMSPEVW